MNIKKIKDAQKLLKDYDFIDCQISRIKRVKEFTKVIIKGEDGNEQGHRMAIVDDEKLSKKILTLINDHYTRQKMILEKKIKDL